MFDAKSNTKPSIQFINYTTIVSPEVAPTEVECIDTAKADLLRRSVTFVTPPPRLLSRRLGDSTTPLHCSNPHPVIWVLFSSLFMDTRWIHCILQVGGYVNVTLSRNRVSGVCRCHPIRNRHLIQEWPASRLTTPVDWRYWLPNSIPAIHSKNLLHWELQSWEYGCTFHEWSSEHLLIWNMTLQ